MINTINDLGVTEQKLIANAGGDINKAIATQRQKIDGMLADLKALREKNRLEAEKVANKLREKGYV